MDIYDSNSRKTRLDLRLVFDLFLPVISTCSCRGGYHIPYHGAGGVRLPDGYRLCCVWHSNSNRYYYHDEWYELLDAQKNRPSINDKQAREKYDARIKMFLEDASTTVISYDDVPWPCEGDAQDMVAVMLTGEETPGSKIKHLKTIALFWHPDKFLSRFFKKLRQQDRERIIEGVLDISKEISRCLEREREEEYKNTKKITTQKEKRQ